MRILIPIIIAALLLPACRCFRPCPQTIETIEYRDTLIRVPPVVVVDTLPFEVVKWDTITQLVTVRVNEAFTSTERDGVRVSARLTPSGIEVQAERLDTVMKLQNVERVRHVMVQADNKPSRWWFWLLIGFVAGIIGAILIRR